MTGKMRSVCSVLLLTALSCLMSFSLVLAAQANQDQEKDVEAMVNAAVKLIQEKGVAAFDELNKGGDAWVKGATGIFVSDGAGIELANPAQPEIVGKNVKDIPGAAETFEGQWKLVQEKGQGWYDGSWQKPGTDKQTSCRSFVKGVEVGGQQYLVGAAYYLD